MRERRRVLEEELQASKKPPPHMSLQDIRNKTELATMRLQCIQRRLRQHVVDEHPLSGLPGVDVLPFMQRACATDGRSFEYETREDWIKISQVEHLKKVAVKQTKFLEGVMEVHAAFRQHFKEQRDLMRKLTKEIVRKVREREREKQRQAEKEKRERMAALKVSQLICSALLLMYKSCRQTTSRSIANTSKTQRMRG